MPSRKRGSKRTQRKALRATKRPVLSREDVLLDISSEDLAAALAFNSPRDQLPRKPGDRTARVSYGQEGTVRLRGNLWRLQYRGEPDGNGRRHQHSIRIGNRVDLTFEQARVAARRMIESVAPRRIAPGTSCTWEAWVDRYLAVYLPLQRTSSQQSTGSVIRVHLLPAFIGLQLHEIRLARIQNWIARQRAQHVAPATIITRYRILRRMLKRARTEGFAVELPAGTDVDLPRSEAIAAQKPRAFTTIELRQILAAAPEPWRTLFMLCAFCGLRISEALGLRWCDVNLAAGRLRIVRQALAGRETAPKTKASTAERRIPPGLVEHLQVLSATRSAPDGLLFPSPHGGGPYHSSGVRRHHLAPLLKQLGIAGRSFHGFRHWLGSTAAREGVPIPALQRVLRHRDPRSTQVYVSIDTHDIDSAIDGVESRYLQAAENVVSAPERRIGTKHENLP